MKKRSFIIFLCFAVLLIIVTMNTRTEARTGNGGSGKGKARDIAAYGRYDTRGGEADSDITQARNYTVRRGDTIYSIARRFSVSPDLILEANRCAGNRITPGMKLRIPGPGKTGNAKAALKPAVKRFEDKPEFQWPLKTVNRCRKDGEEGVKSIGIIINSTPNSNVYASEKGVVKKIGYMRGYGRYIVIMHEKRYITVYSNIEKINVKEGEAVKKGSLLGKISTDSILHFQIGKSGKPQNPLEYLPARS